MITYGSISKLHVFVSDVLELICCSPLISYDSVTSNLDRLAKIKNFTMFYEDLANNALPQWMFITPNMSESCEYLVFLSTDNVLVNDGHDSSVTTAGDWARTFLTPLLSNPHFMNGTLVLLSKQLAVPLIHNSSSLNFA
jgi:hypothetical protein